MASQKKVRLDLLLVERGLADTRSLAQRLILAGRVRVDAQEVIQAGKLLPPDSRVELASPPPFASRMYGLIQIAFRAGLDCKESLLFHRFGKIFR